MLQFPYKKVISRALQMTWQNKFLWLLGFFTLGVQDFDFFLNFDEDQRRNLTEQGVQMATALTTLQLVLIIVAVLIALLAVFTVNAWAKGALIINGYDISEDSPVNIKTSLKKSYQRLATLIGVRLAAGSILIISAAVLGLPIYHLYSIGADDRAVALSVAALVIFLPLLFVVSFTAIFADNFVTVLKMPLNRAFPAGLDLVMRLWHQVALTGIFAVGAALAMLLAVIVSLLVIFAVGAAVLNLIQPILPLPIAPVFLGALYIVFIAVISALKAWQTMVWLLAWKEWIKPLKYEPDASEEPSSFGEAKARPYAGSNRES